MLKKETMWGRLWNIDNARSLSVTDKLYTYLAIQQPDNDDKDDKLWYADFTTGNQRIIVTILMLIMVLS